MIRFFPVRISIVYRMSRMAGVTLFHMGLDTRASRKKLYGNPREGSRQIIGKPAMDLKEKAEVFSFSK